MDMVINMVIVSVFMTIAIKQNIMMMEMGIVVIIAHMDIRTMDMVDVFSIPKIVPKCM